MPKISVILNTDTEILFISEKKGYDVVATKLVLRGTITWTHDNLNQSLTD